MTRELRQANWLFFTSSQIVDAETMVRNSTTSEAVQRHVRYDCSNGHCIRLEGPPVPFPPSFASIWHSSALVIGSTPSDRLHFDGKVIGHDVFVPKRVNPATGDTEVDYLDPDLLHIRLRLRVDGLSVPLEVADGVSLRNSTNFAE